MGVNLVVAVTDGDWYSYLSNRPDLPEVNFWAPGGNVAFRALQQGELFLFKLHAPRNFIVGYGVFAYANTLPCSLAWAGFGEKNGAASFQEMRQRIVRYRKLKGDTREDFVIGCRLLSQPVFFDEDHWIKVPDSWSRNIVSFKKYNTDESDGRHLWEAIQNLSVDTSVEATDLGEEQDRYGTPTLIRPRLGQGAFRIIVTDNYNRKCAVTAEKTLPALDAAHIRPFGDGGSHSPQNGLLLRKDIHSLFDAGYVTVTSEYRFEVSPRIKREFSNGRDYYALHGRQVAIPDAAGAKPDKTSLVWHNENIYRE